jgi:beta-xylosidase
MTLMAGCSESKPEMSEPELEKATTTESALMEPLIRWNFPDLDILEVDGAYYAYATNHNLNNVQVATSDDLRVWQVLTMDALPELPSWALEGHTWAPEVARWPDNSFRMYFTARNAAFPKQCIGVAVAESPLGPFRAMGEQMLVCPEELGGAIDATVFFDDNIPYLIWKNDGNCCGVLTSLFIQRLSSDGLSLEGDRIALLETSESWEGILVEAPTMIKRGDKYHLFYSANDYYSEFYAVGHASSESLFGPFIKSQGPLLSTAGLGNKVIGPGGQDLFEKSPGNWEIFFHGWNISKSARYMYSLNMEVDVGWPE